MWAGFAGRRDEQGAIVSFARERSIPFTEILSALKGAGVRAAGLMHSPAGT